MYLQKFKRQSGKLLDYPHTVGALIRYTWYTSAKLSHLSPMSTSDIPPAHPHFS